MELETLPPSWKIPFCFSEYLPKRQYIVPFLSVTKRVQLQLNQCADHQIVFKCLSFFGFLSSSSRTRDRAV